MRLNLIKNICRIGAVAGVVGTAYFAIKRGEQICKTIDEIKAEAKKLESGKKAGHYISSVPKLARPMLPVVTCAAGSIACMVISERISYKQIAALTATCVYLSKNRDFLQNKLKEVVGEEKLEDIKKEFTTQEAPKLYFGPSVEETGHGDLLCYEGYSGRWFRSSKEAVLEAQAQLQDAFTNDIYCCMNDYYNFLGMTMTQFGHELGWVNNKDWYGPELHFTNTLLEANEWADWGPDGGLIDEPIYVLEIDTLPMYSWQEI